MALETATYIDGLNTSNPASTDGLSQADDHLRLIKSTLKSTFANIDAAVTATEDDLNILTGAAAAGVTSAELQHLNGVTSAIQTQLNALMPSGAIILWSGAASAIPSGFVLCNGSNSTPDLRARFVIGAQGDSGNTYDVGDTGGSATHTLTTAEMPSHNHSATSTDSGHTHTINYSDQANVELIGSTETSISEVDEGGSTRTTSSSQASITTTIASTGGGGAHNNMPPYYALCYIMKT